MIPVPPPSARSLRGWDRGRQRGTRSPSPPRSALPSRAPFPHSPSVPGRRDTGTAGHGSSRTLGHGSSRTPGYSPLAVRAVPPEEGPGRSGRLGHAVPAPGAVAPAGREGPRHLRGHRGRLPNLPGILGIETSPTPPPHACFPSERIKVILMPNYRISSFLEKYPDPLGSANSKRFGLS